MQCDIGLLIKHPLFFGFMANLTKITASGEVEPRYKEYVEALGIRNRRRRIAYIYDKACDIIDAYNDKNDLNCKFSNGRCEEKNGCGRLNGCCYHCHIQTDKGCPSRNLACKFFYCDLILGRKNKPLEVKDIPVLSLLTRRQRYIVKYNVYCTRETFLHFLNIGSILLFFLYAAKKPIDMEYADRKNKIMERQRQSN